MATLGQFLNQHSFVLLAGVLYLGFAVLLWRRGLRWQEIVALLSLAGILFATWWVLHPKPTPMGEAAEIQAQIGRGTPVLLEFQSPY